MRRAYNTVSFSFSPYKWSSYIAVFVFSCTYFLSNSAVNISERSTLGVLVIQCEFMSEHKRPLEEPHGSKFAC